MNKRLFDEGRNQNSSSLLPSLRRAVLSSSRQQVFILRRNTPSKRRALASKQTTPRQYLQKIHKSSSESKANRYSTPKRAASRCIDLKELNMLFNVLKQYCKSEEFGTDDDPNKENERVVKNFSVLKSELRDKLNNSSFLEADIGDVQDYFCQQKSLAKKSTLRTIRTRVRRC